MKKKILITSLLAGMLFTNTACEDNKEEFLSDFSTILYFKQSGETPLTLYKTGETTNYKLTVNKAGSELNSTTEVAISVLDKAALDIYNLENRTEYELLPNDCYQIDQTAMLFAATDLYKQLGIEFNTDKIHDLINADQKSYVLPLQLTSANDSVNSEKNRAFIIPSVEIPSVYFEKNGYLSNSITEDADEIVTLTCPIKMLVDNQWTFDCTVSIDEAMLDQYNQENNTELKLLPADVYEMNKTVSFVPGSSTQDIVIKINKSKLGFENYALPLVLSDITNKNFVIDAKKNSCIFGVKSKINLTVDMLETNALEPTEGALKNLLDGDVATMFHSAWSVAVDGDHYLQVNLKKEISAFSFEYTTRKENGNAAPAEIIVSGSKDGKTFTEIVTINEGLPTEGAQQYASKTYTADFSFKHLRFTVTKNKTGGKFFVWSELGLSGK